MLDLSVLCATAVVVVVAVVVNVGRLSVVPQRAPASAPANLASGNENHQTKQLDPNVAVLSARDLPGYKLISSAEALRAGGGTVPNSRDNLFQRSEAGSPDYRMTEAIVVVYGVVGDAVTEVELLRQYQESQGVKVSPGLIGSQSMTWAERSSVPGYTLVHTVFRIERVVAQVTVLGKDNPTLSDEAQVLAAAQKIRLLALLHDSA